MNYERIALSDSEHYYIIKMLFLPLFDQMQPGLYISKFLKLLFNSNSDLDKITEK